MERILDENGTGIVKEFPNGFSDWKETFAEICVALGIKFEKRYETVGDGIGLSRGEFWDYAEDLTDKFETKYKGIKWSEDIDPKTGEEYDYFYTIDKFLEENL